MQSKHLQVKKQIIILIYCIQTMKRLPCLLCSVNITFTKTRRGITLIYGTSTILFVLNIFSFQHVLLLRSPSRKSCHGHSPDNVCSGVSGYGFGLTIFVLSKNYDVCFYSYWL